MPGWNGLVEGLCANDAAGGISERSGQRESDIRNRLFSSLKWQAYSWSVTFVLEMGSHLLPRLWRILDIPLW